MNEKPTNALIQAKQAAYAGIASSIQTSDPSVYPLFQGKQWTTRLEIGFAALFAAVVAGVLVLLISVTLILLKLELPAAADRRAVLPADRNASGIRPGRGTALGRDARRRAAQAGGGRAGAERAAVLLRADHGHQRRGAAVGAEDPDDRAGHRRGFIYRKPFQHLFSAVGYGVIGSQRAGRDRSGQGRRAARANTRAAATVAVPGFAAYRAGRWARRNPGQAAGLAVAAASGGAAARWRPVLGRRGRGRNRDRTVGGRHSGTARAPADRPTDLAPRWPRRPAPLPVLPVPARLSRRR